MRFDRLASLSASDVSRIHQATLEILRDTGMAVTSEAALDIFRRHGFEVENQIVRFREEEIEAALASAPSGFVWMARDPEKSIYVGGDSCAFGPSGGSPFITTSEGVQRPGTLEDLEKFFKLTQMIDVIDFNREALMPGGVPPGERSLRTSHAEILMTDKPYTAMTHHSVRMLCIVYGINEETYREHGRQGKVYGVGGINPMSPLMLSGDQADRLIQLSGMGVPSIVASMPTAGVSSPCTLAGTLLLQNAEQLGCLVLAQLVCPGVAFLYGCISTIANMLTGSAAIGAPEARVLEHASAQMARFYGLPTRGDGGLTDAFSCDFQAGAESSLHFSSVIRSGINVMPGCGALASWNSVSLEKFVLDAENIRYARRMVRPLEVNEETLAVDLIKRIGPRGQYITDPHTFQHFRTEFHYPTAFARTDYDTWCQQGREEAFRRAQREVERILQEYQRPDLDPALERDLERYVERAMSAH